MKAEVNISGRGFDTRRLHQSESNSKEKTTCADH